jgi:hypothetical protein
MSVETFLFVATPLSPILIAAGEAVVWAAAKIFGVTKRGGQRLLRLSLVGAAAGAALTLLYTIGWMIWYETSTGYDPGNAPVFWILFLGPAGAAAGQVAALLKWSLERAPDSLSTPRT